jgi:amino acid transporter
MSEPVHMSAPVTEKPHKEGYIDGDSEKGDTFAVADERYHFDASELDRVQRKLKQRHVQLFVCINILENFSLGLI